LILQLRDRGCTVFFSSHVLSDAEALCNRVAIVAGGKLIAEGQLSELLALRVHGWELVVSGVSRDVIDRRGAGILKVTPLGGNRYTLELPLSPPPEQVLSELVAQGASLVSLNPIRDTLEDLFVQKVARADADRGLSERPEAR
jgi:ABC-2 type transport system ATP-binding protein